MARELLSNSLMIKKYSSYYILSFIVEALLGAGALYLAGLLGNAFHLGRLAAAGRELAPLIVPAWLYWVVALGLPGLLYLNRAHTFPYRPRLIQLAWPTGKAVIQLVVLVIGLSFLLRSPQPGRLVVLLFGLIAYPAALLKQTGFQWLLARLEPHREILLIGNSASALKFISSLREEWPCGISIFGLLTDEPSFEPGTSVEGVKVIGRVSVWEKILLKNQIIDEVVIFPNGKMGVNLNQIIGLGRELQVRVRVAVGAPEPETGQSHPTFQRLGWADLISFQPNPENFVSMFVKRVFDRAGAAFLLLLFSPLFLLIAFLIKIGSPGPVIFYQKRSGFRRVPFKMYKFRTMYDGAQFQRRHLLAANEMNGPVFKIRNDPRVTRVGRFLRRFSLDELPQLFNVLKGDMSLVGPRPLPISEAVKCGRWEKRRFSFKPGITCLWQVNGRNLLDFPEWMRLDLAYVNNWSLGLDFKILLKTISAVLTGRGAY